MEEFFLNNAITIYIVLFVFEVLMGILAQSIAEKKGHSKSWFWAGLLLSFIGVIWVAGLPDEHLRKELRRLGQTYQTAPVPASAGGYAPAGDDAELAAVLAAAVAAMGEADGARYALRSFRPAGEGSTAWRRAGRN